MDQKESKAFGIQSKKPLSTEELKIEESLFYLGIIVKLLYD
jgi:hypothetical protein